MLQLTANANPGVASWTPVMTTETLGLPVVPLEPTQDTAYLFSIPATNPTYTLEPPAYVGQLVSFRAVGDLGGSVTIQTADPFDQSGDTELTFDDSGDFVLLMGAPYDGSGPTWQLITNDGAAVPVGPDAPIYVNAGASGAAIIPASARVVLCDTSSGAITLFAPSASGGSLSIRIINGSLPVVVTPYTSSQGINGSAGSTFTIDPGIDPAVVFVGDPLNQTWWLLA